MLLLPSSDSTQNEAASPKTYIAKLISSQTLLRKTTRKQLKCLTILNTCKKLLVPDENIGIREPLKTFCTLYMIRSMMVPSFANWS